MYKIFICILIILNSGCAILHHVQVGEIDNRAGVVAVPFEVKVSETGVDMGDVKNIARAFNTKGGNDGGRLAEAVQYFQMGPKTGAPVYSDKYAEKMIYMIHQQCKDGKVTGLMSVRETRKYPVISGEIVKVTGYCLRNREPASQSNYNQEEELYESN